MPRRWPATPLGAAPASPLFRHHAITRSIPQAKNLTWGYGTPVLADFDRDGDLDIVTAEHVQADSVGSSDESPAAALMAAEFQGEVTAGGGFALGDWTVGRAALAIRK